jgi:hypothetical protein
LSSDQASQLAVGAEVEPIGALAAAGDDGRRRRVRMPDARREAK